MSEDRFGTKIDQNISSAQEALELTGLTYQVRKEALYLANGDMVRNRYATVRTDIDGPDSILGIISRGYQVIQNSEVLSIFDPLIESKQLVYERIGVLGNGYRMWMLIRLPDPMIIRGNDEVNKYILVTNSFDGSLSVNIKLTAIRVVCSNSIGFALGSSGENIHIRHIGATTYQEKLELARNMYGQIQTKYDEIERNMKQMSLREISDQQLLKYVESLVFNGKNENQVSAKAINKRDRIMALADIGYGNGQGTLWDAVNAVTQYVDHDIKSKRYIESVWFGSGSKLKTRAYDRALDLMHSKQ